MENITDSEFKEWEENSTWFDFQFDSYIEDEGDFLMILYNDDWSQFYNPITNEDDDDEEVIVEYSYHDIPQNIRCCNQCFNAYKTLLNTNIVSVKCGMQYIKMQDLSFYIRDEDSWCGLCHRYALFEIKSSV